MPWKIETLDQLDNSISIAFKAYFYNSTQSCSDTLCLCQSEKLCLKRLIEDTEQRISVGFFFFSFRKVITVPSRDAMDVHNAPTSQQNRVRGATHKSGGKDCPGPGLNPFHTHISQPAAMRPIKGRDRSVRSIVRHDKKGNESKPPINRSAPDGG